jgi:hypothetical protein
MSEHSDAHTSLRQQVFRKLSKNPLLKPKDLCSLLGLEYNRSHRNVIQQYKKQWKSEYEKQQGLVRCVPDGLHNCFFRGKLNLVVGELDLPKAYKGSSWVPTKARNRFCVFRSGLGRIRLFENGTVELFVRKPSSLGKAMQLFCDGFVKTGLVGTDQIEAFQKTLMRRVHATFDVGHRLDYMRVNAFKDTHRFEFVAGDKSHPTCYEFMLEYHAEVEQARRLVEEIGEVFSLLKGSQSGVGKLNQHEFGLV